MHAPSSHSSRPAIWRWLRGSYEAAAFAYVMVLLCLVFLATSAAGAVLLVVLPRRSRQPFRQAMIQCAFQVALGGMRLTRLFRTDLDALGQLDNASGLIVAPNHPSLIDVMPGDGTAALVQAVPAQYRAAHAAPPP